MRNYLEAIAVGLSVGILYGLLKFRSPAPPMIALVGLLAMLAGEQLVTFVRDAISPAAASDEDKPGQP